VGSSYLSPDFEFLNIKLGIWFAKSLGMSWMLGVVLLGYRQHLILLSSHTQLEFA